jgi:hypothetical protein
MAQEEVPNNELVIEEALTKDAVKLRTDTPLFANNEPVTIKDPDIIALPVYGKSDPLAPPPPATVIGNVEPSPFVNVIVLDTTEAVIKKELVLKDVTPGTYDAV